MALRVPQKKRSQNFEIKRGCTKKQGRARRRRNSVPSFIYNLARSLLLFCLVKKKAVGIYGMSLKMGQNIFSQLSTFMFSWYHALGLSGPEYALLVGP